MFVLTMRTSFPLLASKIYERASLLVGAVATIGVRAFINFDPLKRDKDRLADTLNVLQMIVLISSLITNTLGTGIISLKAW